MDLEKHRLEQAERLVTVEQGIKHISESLDACKLPEMQEDIVSLKITQRWTKWVSRTALGAIIFSIIGYFIV